MQLLSITHSWLLTDTALCSHNQQQRPFTNTQTKVSSLLMWPLSKQNNIQYYNLHQAVWLWTLENPSL